MATSLNNMIDGFKLYPGYEFLVTVDTNSENVVLVSGLIGSRKYRGALLSAPVNSIRACVSDNVFTNDFSTKNSYSLENMSITNYYSHKKLKSNDVKMFCVNKRAKENYICANCKMKISYYSKKESKSPPPDYSKHNINSSKSDITVLKQTLSYPDISDETLSQNINKSKVSSLYNSPEKCVKSQKRKREHANNSISNKKPKLLTSFESEISNISDKKSKVITVLPKLNQNNQENPTIIIEESINPESKSTISKTKNNAVFPEMKIKIESKSPILNKDEKSEMKSVIKTSDIDSLNSEIKILPENLSKLNETKIDLDIVEQNFSETEEKSDQQNYEEYRSMPLTLSTLNHVNLNDIDKTSDDSLNRECPKPKKIWMKMIENEDIQNSIDPILSSSESGNPPIIDTKPIVHIKSHQKNRNYKIKQTLHDKVILTIDKRPEKHKLEPSNTDCIDIYTFTEDNEYDSTAQIQLINHDCQTNPINEIPLNSIVDIKAIDSIKSTTSSSCCSKSSKKSQNQLYCNDLISMKNQSIIQSTNSSSEIVNKITVKMEPDSTTDSNLFNNINLQSKINSCENNIGINFNLNDIVWAKITGYPYWPGKIISFTHEDDTFIGCIEWYAWSEISFIKVNNLFHFNTHFPTKYQKRNRNVKYQEAVKLAKYDCGMIDLSSSKPTSIDNENTNSIKGSDTDSESNAASYTSASL